MSGFCFQRRQGTLDIRSISKCDVNRIINEVDIDALQNHLENVAFSALNEDDLEHLPDPLIVKLFRLAQLLIEYLLYAQDQLTSNLKKLAQKYASKKRDILRKRRELLQLQESTATMKTQIKVKKQNIRTLEMLIEKTGKEKLIENKENLMQRKISENSSINNAMPSSSSDSTLAATSVAFESKIVLYIVNARDCQTVFASLDRTIDSVKDECKRLLSDHASKVDLKYKGLVLDGQMTLRDASLKNEDQLLLVEEITDSSHASTNNNEVADSGGGDISDNFASKRGINKGGKTRSRPRRLQNYENYERGRDNSDDSESGSDFDDGHLQKGRHSDSTSEADKNIVSEFVKVLETRERTLMNSQSQGDSMVVLREIKDMMESFMKSAVKTIAESRHSSNSSAENANNIDTSVLIIEKWNKLETTIKSEVEKRLANLSVEAKGNNKFSKKHSNFGTIASDSDDSIDSDTEQGKKFRESSTHKKSAKNNFDDNSSTLMPHENSAFSSKSDGNTSLQPQTVISSNHTIVVESLDDSTNTGPKATAANLDKVNNNNNSQEKLDDGEETKSGDPSTKAKSSSNSNSRSNSPPNASEQVVQESVQEKKAPERPPRSGMPSNLEKKDPQKDPQKELHENETVIQNQIAPTKASRSNTPVLDHLDELPIRDNSTKIFFIDYFDVDSSIIKSLSPPLDLSYKSESHIDTIVFSLRKSASDKLKIPYQNVYFKLDSNNDIKLGIDLSNIQVSQIPLLCQQGRLKIATSGVVPINNLDTAKNSSTSEVNLGSSLTSSAQIDELLSKFRSSDFSQDSLSSSLDQQLPTRISSELSKHLEMEKKDSKRNPDNLKLLQRKLQDEYLELSDKERISDDEYKSKKVTMSQLKDMKESPIHELQPPTLDINTNSDTDFQRRLLEQELKRVSERPGGISDDELLGKIANLKKMRTSLLPEQMSKSIDESRRSYDSDIISSQISESGVSSNSTMNDSTADAASLVNNEKEMIPDGKNDLASRIERKSSKVGEDKNAAKHADSVDVSNDSSFLNSNLANFKAEAKNTILSDSSALVNGSFDNSNLALDNSIVNKSLVNDSNVVEQNDSAVYDFVDEPSSDHNDKSLDAGTFLTSSMDAKPNTKKSIKTDEHATFSGRDSFDSASTASPKEAEADSDRSAARGKASRNSRYYYDDDEFGSDDSKTASIANTKDSLDLNSTLNTDATSNLITPFSTAEIVNKADNYEAAARSGRSDLRDSTVSALSHDGSEVQEFVNSENSSSSDEGQLISEQIAVKKGFTTGSNQHQQPKYASSPIATPRKAGEKDEANEATPFKSLKEVQNRDRKGSGAEKPATAALQASTQSQDTDDSNSMAYSESNQDDNSLVRSFDSK
jgi:hypothetical protein